MTLDEWVDKYASSLRDNFKANIKNYSSHLSSDDQASLLRCHLIMVREWNEHPQIFRIEPSSFGSI